MSQTMSTPAGQSTLVAAFVVRDTLCGLDATGVEEVIRLGRLTPVRYAPEEVVGIINLRGKIVTIIDLGLRLGFGKAVTGSESRIFIIEDCHEFIGLLADRVEEVVEVDSDCWRSPPANVNCGQGRFFKGVYRVRGRVITLLDAGQILGEGGR